MIQLKADCLLFQTTGGEQFPVRRMGRPGEPIGDPANLIDPEIVRNAAAAVLHYFKREMHGESVSVAEFAAALEKALQGLGFSIFADATPPVPLRVQRIQPLRRRQEFRRQLRTVVLPPSSPAPSPAPLEENPQVVRFNGLRPCVKQLVGADRWSARCEILSDQIVDYLRTCCQADTRTSPCTLVVH